MMNFDQLKKRYSMFSSWAIWDPEDISNTKIIEQKISDLNPLVVMVGLNCSKPLKYPWQNFHSRHRGSNDRRLAAAFNRGPYRGAYMTDLIKNVPEPNSRLVQHHLKSPLVNKHCKKFDLELSLLGSKIKKFIVFGSATGVFGKTMIELYQGRFEVTCLPHYSSRMSDKNWLDLVKKLL